MRDRLPDVLEKARISVGPYTSVRGDLFGAFRLGALRVMSSGLCKPGDGSGGWEHVSVSCSARCPTWHEMHFAKTLFWDDGETVLQFHPKQSAYVNDNENVLHLWKKAGVDHELPPKDCV